MIYSNIILLIIYVFYFIKILTIRKYNMLYSKFVAPKIDNQNPPYTKEILFNITNELVRSMIYNYAITPYLAKEKYKIDTFTNTVLPKELPEIYIKMTIEPDGYKNGIVVQSNPEYKFQFYIDVNSSYEISE